MKYFSDEGQDKFLNENFFHNNPNGFYVDIGAFDGHTSSKTKFFERLGWQGVCVEPNPIQIKELRLNRNCDIVNAAILDNEEKHWYVNIEGNWRLASGLLEEIPLRLARMIIGGLCSGDKGTLYEVPSLHINTLLKQYCGQRTIDLLDVDAEGSEIKILKALDYDKYNIRFICLEYHDYTDEGIETFLNCKGYFSVWNHNDRDCIFKKL